MREEIESGLKNAVERGDSLEDAVNSFVNAGYNPVEVREAAKNVASGATNIFSESKPVKKENASAEQSSTDMFNTTKRPFQKEAPEPQIDNLEKIEKKLESSNTKIDTKNANPQINPNQDIEKAAPKKTSARTIVVISLIILIFLLFAFLAGVIIFKNDIISWLASS